MTISYYKIILKHFISYRFTESLLPLSWLFPIKKLKKESRLTLETKQIEISYQN